MSAATGDDDAVWTRLATGRRSADDAPVSRARVFGGILLAAVVVIVAVALVSVFAARQLAETEAVRDASDVADVIADALVQPVVTDALLAGDPAALASIDEVVRGHVLGDSLVRVKLWDATGRIVYSDEPRLIGQRFELEDDERDVLVDPHTDAEVSNVRAPENQYEEGYGTLLEVYRPVWAPDGSALLFETYFRYDDVTERSGELWRGFAAVTVGSILLLLVLLVPVLRRLFTVLGRLRAQRESLLLRSVEASADERKRIAGTLHDGVVQDLVASSYSLSVSEARSTAAGDDAAAADLRAAGTVVRGSIGGLRSLLVEIYPPGLATAGLRAALGDLAQSVTARGIVVDLDIDDAVALADADQRLVFRVVQECLANVVKHSGATRVAVSIRDERGTAVLRIDDDGRGFDPARAIDAPADGHFGLRVLADVASDAGATLDLRTAPGAGTSWRLRVGEP